MTNKKNSSKQAKKSQKVAKKAKKKAARAERGKLWKLMRFFIALCVWGIIGVAVIVGWYSLSLPDIEEAANKTRSPTITVTDESGKTVATYGNLYGRPIAIEETPEYLAQAIMATEDRRFYDHFGIDFIGLARAMAINIKAMRIKQGGSTITQQVAKNLFLSREKTIKRKVQELLLAFWLENKFTKNQILTLYINRVYFGSGTYGIEAASRKYFSQSATQLNLPQAAMLAGLLKAPSYYSPLSNPEAARKRTLQVLDNMLEARYINEQKEKEAVAQLANLKFREQIQNSSVGKYYADWAISQLSSFLGDIDRDVTVVTSIDIDIQNSAEEILNEELKGTDLEGAIVVLNPHGEIKALVGGKDYGKSQFNRATQALRQPGSAFKPFVYLAALEFGWLPNDMVEDKPIKIGDWQPDNYGKKYRGVITIREALAESVNTVAVYLSENVGRQKVIETTHKMGIISPIKNEPSMPLGTSEVSLLELTSAYATFSNDGFGSWAFGILEITGNNGETVYMRSGSGLGKIIQNEHLSAMNSMLSDVIRKGTGKRAALIRQCAGKTGTSQDYRDAWFIGYTADYVVGVWVGKDDNSPMDNVTGGSIPAKIWKKVMQKAHKHPSSRALVGIK